MIIINYLKVAWAHDLIADETDQSSLLIAKIVGQHIIPNQTNVHFCQIEQALLRQYRRRIVEEQAEVIKVRVFGTCVASMIHNTEKLVV